MFRPPIMKCFLSNKLMMIRPTASWNGAKNTPLLSHHVAVNRNYSDSTSSSTPMFQGLYSSLSESTPVLKSQQLLELIHDQSHLPWWATIIASTVALRLLITFPLSAYQVSRCYSITHVGIGALHFFFYIWLALHLWEGRKSETRNGSVS